MSTVFVFLTDIASLARKMYEEEIEEQCEIQDEQGTEIDLANTDSDSELDVRHFVFHWHNSY